MRRRVFLSRESDRGTIPIRKTRSFTGWSYKEAAINYTDYGEGKCLIFLHGWGGSIASFGGLAEPLSLKFRVIIPDLYGFGETPHPDFPLTLDDYAKSVADLMSELGINEAVLVGHSFGGRIAMRLAARDCRVAGIILMDSAGARSRRGPAYYLKVFAYKFAKKMNCKSLPKGSEDYARLSGAMKKTFVNIVNESSEKDAARIRVPALLLWGSEDRDTPLYMCRRLHRLIKGSECLLLEGAGHFAYLEHLDYTRRVIKAFRENL